MDADGEEIERLALELATRIGKVRGRRGRDYIRKLRFGRVLDDLDAAAASAASTAPKPTHEIG